MTIKAVVYERDVEGNRVQASEINLPKEKQVIFDLGKGTDGPIVAWAESLNSEDEFRWGIYGDGAEVEELETQTDKRSGVCDTILGVRNLNTGKEVYLYNNYQSKERR